MAKIKLIVVILISFLGMLFSMFWLMSFEEQELEQSLAKENEHTVTLLTKLEELTAFQLETVAKRLAMGPLAANLAALESNRKTMFDIEAEIYNPNLAKLYSEADLEGVRVQKVMERKEFINGFVSYLLTSAELSPGNKSLNDEEKKLFAEDVTDTLKSCLSKSVYTCYYKFTYAPLKEEFATVKEEYAEVDLDLAIVVDSHGTAWARANNPKWANIQQFADKYSVVMGVQLKRDKPLHDIIFMEEEKKFYQVVATPVFDRGVFVGTIMVGREIDKNLLTSLAKTLSAGVAYVQKDGKILSTTIEEQQLEELLSVNSIKYPMETPQILQDERFFGSSVPLLGNYSNNQLRIIVATSRATAVSPFDTLTSFMPIIVLVLLIICIIAVQIVFQGSLAPFEKLEQGIHEVISGNQEYYFPFADIKLPLARNMGQALNLMLAVLLGRPLPEEEEEAAVWQENVEIDEEVIARSTKSNGEPDGEGKDALPMDGEQPSEEEIKELMDESAESYYRRIFNEYIDIRQSLGEDVETITYVKFVEKVVRNEQMLREKYNVRFVRFKIKEKDGKAALIPVFIP